MKVKTTFVLFSIAMMCLLPMAQNPSHVLAICDPQMDTYSNEALSCINLYAPEGVEYTIENSKSVCNVCVRMNTSQVLALIEELEKE